MKFLPVPFPPLLATLSPVVTLAWTKVNINISGPLGQRSQPDCGDIPTCVRSLPGPRVDQEDWLQVAAVHCCPG